MHYNLLHYYVDFLKMTLNQTGYDRSLVQSQMFSPSAKTTYIKLNNHYLKPDNNGWSKRIPNDSFYKNRPKKSDAEIDEEHKIYEHEMKEKVKEIVKPVHK